MINLINSTRTTKLVIFTYKGSLSGVTPRIASNFGKQ